MSDPLFSVPLFSVIVTCYNKSAEIATAVASVRAQGGDLELIVVDDCSTDSSVAVLRSLDLDHLICQTRNTGALGAYLAGFRAARGRYLVMLDGDDQLAPGILSSLKHRDILSEDTCIRLGMKPLSQTQDTTVQTTTRFAYRPGYWLAATQNTGGTAYVLPKALFDQIEATPGFQWPEITVQDHIIPAIFALTARRFIKLRQIGYLYEKSPAAPSLSTFKTRLHHDRLVSDWHIYSTVKNATFPAPTIIRMLLKLAYVKRLRKIARLLSLPHGSLLSLYRNDKNTDRLRLSVLSRLNNSQNS